MAVNFDSGGYEFLRRGRSPFAVAHLSGCDAPSVRGTVSFFDTPLGILVCAELLGDDTFEGVYGFCLGAGEGGCRESDHACRQFPLVYAKDGRGRTSWISERLRQISLVGRCVFLKESRTDPLCASHTLACGVIDGG